MSAMQAPPPPAVRAARVWRRSVNSGLAKSTASRYPKLTSSRQRARSVLMIFVRDAFSIALRRDPAITCCRTSFFAGYGFARHELAGLELSVVDDKSSAGNGDDGHGLAGHVVLDHRTIWGVHTANKVKFQPSPAQITIKPAPHAVLIRALFPRHATTSLMMKRARDTLPDPRSMHSRQSSWQALVSSTFQQRDAAPVRREAAGSVAWGASAGIARSPCTSIPESN